MVYLFDRTGLYFLLAIALLVTYFSAKIKVSGTQIPLIYVVVKGPAAAWDLF